uniref:site-specific DNA-methyltransferase (cytosine-N(4)-specific) n=1 Tax=Saccharopolyspora sp. TaxID=33915 RepID=O52710_9PSEU|nr:SapI M2 methyltransferase [Saccharopolyspora sp.]
MSVDAPSPARRRGQAATSGRGTNENRLPIDLGVTFRDNRNRPVHSWYPYVEGFSAAYVEGVLAPYNGHNVAVYDPFGGSGTLQSTASWLGINSFYSEVNPFMRFVAEAKVNATLKAAQNKDVFRCAAKEFLDMLSEKELAHRGRSVDLSQYYSAFPGRDFFEEEHIRQLLAACDAARLIGSDYAWVRQLLLLACAANAVHSSNMTRRADLRRRRQNEYINRKVDVARFISDTVQAMLDDVEQVPFGAVASHYVSDDCRDLPSRYIDCFDIAITSPPYLNGTNYFRNTKIELWLLGFLSHESELPKFCREAITAGINNVSGNKALDHHFDVVEDVATKLDDVAPDRRIPKLVRHYFSDMYEVLTSVRSSLRLGGRFILDIGDSKFYGVHVPVDRILVELGKQVGFQLHQDVVIARRHSRDKTPLVQVELEFRKA